MTRDQVIQVIRNSGMTFHLGMPFEVVIDQMTRVIALVEIEATVKATRMAADAINEVQASHWPKEADALTLAIQHLNSNPYALTKDECIDVLRSLRKNLEGPKTGAIPCEAYMLTGNGRKA